MTRRSPARQPCARWGCDRQATFDKPLCYEHWKEWEAWELEECSRCHWVYAWGEAIAQDLLDQGSDSLFLCDARFGVVRVSQGEKPPWPEHLTQDKPVLAHAELERPIRYVYVLKLSDGTFYVGQTNDLAIRLREHRDGIQAQTRGKTPKLVYFEEFVGVRYEVNRCEDDLTRLTRDGAGRRRLMKLIEKFRAPLRLLDLEA